MMKHAAFVWNYSIRLITTKSHSTFLAPARRLKRSRHGDLARSMWRACLCPGERGVAERGCLGWLGFAFL